jgi:membrane fusion protein, multidrug efflux system
MMRLKFVGGVATRSFLGVWLAAGMAFYGAGCSSESRPEPAKMVVRYSLAQTLVAGQISSKPTYIAVLRGDEETDLSFKVGGILETIARAGETVDWREGSEVAAGEMLARLKQADFVNALDSAKARAELARKVTERGEKLIGQGAISKQEFDIMQADKAASAANLAQREQDLRDSVLQAPYKGVILARLARSGETVPAGKPVLRYASLDRMSVELGLPDKAVSKVAVGQAIPLVISGMEGQAVMGRVSEVGVAAKEAGRLFKVVLKVDNQNRRLKSGMTASVTFDEDILANAEAVLVPLSALAAKPDGALFVYVVGEDGKAHVRLVTTEELVRSDVVVTKGLKAGEKVVVAGVGHLYDEAPVEAALAERL